MDGVISMNTRTPLLPDAEAGFDVQPLQRQESADGVELQVVNDSSCEANQRDAKRTPVPPIVRRNSELNAMVEWMVCLRRVFSSCPGCRIFENDGAPYVVYCVLCFFLAALLFAVTTWDVFFHAGRPKHWLRHLRPEEEALEAFVGGALLIETMVRIRYMGVRSFCRNSWRALDGIVVLLTLVTWLVLTLRRRIRRKVGVNVTEDDVEEADLPFLMARFALQPFRMLSAIWMVRRARSLAGRQQRDDFEELLELGPLQNASSLLTQDLALQIASHFTPSLRYANWHLIYSPRKHGTSMQTFYKQQSGANVVALRDTRGVILGGFASLPWKLSSGRAYGSAESFVFSTDYTPSPGNVEESESSDALEPSIHIFHARPHRRGDVLQWSDDCMLAMGRAVVVRNQFLRGSSYKCDTYGSPKLSQNSEDFVIQDFECWSVGSPS